MLYFLCTLYGILMTSKVLWAQYSDDKIVDYDEQRAEAGPGPYQVIIILSGSSSCQPAPVCEARQYAAAAGCSHNHEVSWLRIIGTLAKRYVCAARVFND